jgi:hypothetical protein
VFAPYVIACVHVPSESRPGQAKRGKRKKPIHERAFEEAAAQWLRLAEQTDWIDGEKSHLRGEEK